MIGVALISTRYDIEWHRLVNTMNSFTLLHIADQRIQYQKIPLMTYRMLNSNTVILETLHVMHINRKDKSTFVVMRANSYYRAFYEHHDIPPRAASYLLIFSPMS